MPSLALNVTAYTDLNHWHWRLTDENGKYLADHTVALADGAPEYPGYLDLRSHLRHLAAPDREAEDDRRNLAAFGDWLGVRAFGPIAETLAGRAPVTVRVQVPRAAAELVLRPFEAARLAGKPLALAGVTLVFEVEGDAAKPAEQPVGDTLRMLAVFSLPPGGSPLNLRAERQALRRLVRELTGGGKHAAIELRTLQYGTSRQILADALAEEAGWDLVHFSGHGLPGELVLEGADGRVTSAELAALLRPAKPRLKLVTVSACHSAAAVLRDALRGLGIDPGAAAEPDRAPPSPVARQLVEALDCAVLAMRYPVEDAFAIDLARHLYHHLLARHESLPAALRRALAEATGAKVKWPPGALSLATPALFGHRAAGLKLIPPKAAPGGFAPPDTGLFAFPPEPERFVGRVAAMTAASAALAADSPHSGVLFHGMAGAGKSACANELARHIEPTGSFGAYVWWKAPDDGSDISGALAAFAGAMESQLPGFAMIQVVGRDDALAPWLPRLRALLEANAILIVLDNLESLLTADGRWRDAQFGRVVGALLDHRGLARTVLTSRIKPAALPGRVLVQPIHALPRDEALLLMRELPHLGRLMRNGGGGLARRLFAVIQGHPKLIELAEGLAADTALLAAQVERAEQAYRDGAAPLERFFTDGTSALTDTALLQALTGWTDTLAATLPAAARTLFQFLCALEENDRESWIVGNNWADLWHRLGHPDPVPELAATLAPLIAAALVEPVPLNEQVTCFAIHPGVAEAGRATAGPALTDATDTELAAFWVTVFRQASAAINQGTGPLIRRAGLAAAPYLLRCRKWSAAAALLESVVHQDQSSATVAAVLPLLRYIVAATAGSNHELTGRGVLANIMRLAGRTAEAEAEMREIIAAAATHGKFRTASVATGDLITLLRTSGQTGDALALVDAMKDYTRQAELGPWSRLSDEGRRLQILLRIGRYDEVLDTVRTLRVQMAELPEESGADESVSPWQVRELILVIGHGAALQTEHWSLAIEFSAEILSSVVDRGGSAQDQANVRLDDCRPLLSLGRLHEARSLLDDCRRVFQGGENFVGLGKTLSALAELEHRLDRLAAALAFEEQALRLKYYRKNDPADCAVSHSNLAIYLFDGADTQATALAHRLAGLTICYLANLGHGEKIIYLLGNDLARLGPDARALLPASFAELVAAVEAVEGVRFGEMVGRLNRGRYDLDDLLGQLIEAGFRLAEQRIGAAPEPA